VRTSSFIEKQELLLLMRDGKITDISSLSSERGGVGTLWRCATPIVGVGNAKKSLKAGLVPKNKESMNPKSRTGFVVRTFRNV